MEFIIEAAIWADRVARVIEILIKNHPEVVATFVAIVVGAFALVDWLRKQLPHHE
jgi:hypothetical protein